MLLLMTSVASATITSGYYRLKSYNDKYMTENTSSHILVCSDLMTGNYAQVWYLNVNGSDVTLKNALTQKYIQNQQSTSASFLTGDSPFTFTYAEPSSGVYTFKNHNNGWWDGGLHCDGSLEVVFWDVTEAKSKWSIEPVVVDNDELANQQAAMTEASTSQLTTFFTSEACTALRSTYQSMTDEALRTAMSELSTTVQNMAIKVKNNSWTAYGGWDKTERTFRIADYKAYSSHSRWTSILGYGHLMGRLSNPTGIWADAGNILQIYVGDIPDGQAVKLEVAGHGQASGTTYDLHEGMNCLLIASSGNCFVFYEVDNTTDGGTPYKLMSNYTDVTVHIEGGTVQGYFDLTRGDDDDDWTQLTTHLLSKENVCLKSSKHVMNLKKSLLTTALNGSSVVDMMNVWKNLSEGQDELTGRSDAYGGETTYGQYCNNLSSVTSLGGDDESGNPHATNYGTFYYYDYHDRIFNATNLLTVADNMWCIAHEQGHNRQSPINMVGNTEISNNLFSNVAIYKQGRYTSRTANIQDVFNDYLDGISWPERVARSCNGVDGYNQQMLHFNWSLYMFFHLNGNDPDFFPRLYDALRADPMTRKDVSVSGETVTGGQFTAASDDYLKFYVKCCEVSGYDLTDFFTSYGFFMIPSSESLTLGDITTTQYQFINDYSKSCLYVTQEMIDAAKATVSALNLPKANITFIEDRVTAPLATYEGHAEGEKRTINPDAPVSSFGAVGEMGQYTAFGAPCSAYTYNISARGNVTVSGTGAVGIIVYDNSNNIVGFYNTTTFRLPASAFDENGLKSGYSIKAAAGDGTMAAATRDEAIVVNEFPKTDRWYTFCTPLRENRFTQSNGVGQGMTGTTVTTPTAAMQWKFVERDGEPETFDIINRADNSYISPVPGDGAQLSTSSARPAAGWKLGDAQTEGFHIIYSGETQLHQGGSGNDYKTLNYGYWYGSYNITDDGCQFTIEEIYDSGCEDVKIVYGTTAHTTYGDLKDLTWTSKVTAGVATGDNTIAGLTMVASDGAFNQFSNWNSHHNIAYHPQTANTDATLTLTAPAGYVIKDYSMLVARASSAAHTYTVTNAAGVSVDVPFGSNASSYATVSQSDINAASTAITVTTNDVSKWLAIADFTVTLAKSLPLNVVGDKSYATLYLPYDVQTDENTKAYYITTVSGGYAQLTELTDGKIPAFTAVVLVNSEAASSATLSMANSLTPVVSEEDNLLKGTIVGKTLDLSDETPYYSMGRKDGQIGFYKFDNGVTTSITLGANKAYLATAASGGAVKGFTFDFDGLATDINTVANSQQPIANSPIYNLAGQRVEGSRFKVNGSGLKTGIYIVNGKKVLVK